MRDRREALKLLAGGTAAAIGTSIITTNTAFADQGTTTCLPTNWPTTAPAPQANVTYSRTGASAFITATISATVFPFNHTCPAEYTASGEYAWSVTGGLVLATNSSSPTAISSGFNAGLTSVRIYASSALTTGPNSNGTYTVTVRYRAVCTRGSRRCWRCATSSTEFRITGNGNNLFTSPANPTLTYTTAGCTS